MIDPTKLIAGATAVYGEAGMAEHFGEIVPVPEERVMVAEDRMKLAIGGRELVVLDTPGHALHHFSLYDPRSRGIFTGDTFGIAYNELASDNGPYLFPPSTPVQFDPDAWHDTIDRYLVFSPQAMYLTHFGKVTNVRQLADELHERIDDLAVLATSVNDKGEQRYQLIKEGLIHIMLSDIRRHGCELDRAEILKVLEMDIDLNTQGLVVWLDRKNR